MREICRYFVCLGCGLTSASVSFSFSCELTSTLGCPKMHENAYFHLTLCIWLSLYLRNHHQNLVSFRVNMWCGHHFLHIQRIFRKILMKKCHHTNFTPISTKKVELRDLRGYIMGIIQVSYRDFLGWILHIFLTQNI